MNRAIIVGNLTRDPEIRQTQSGKACATFTVAVQRRFTNQQGVREADFLPVVAWGRTAELCGQYLHKGDRCGVSGAIQTRSYDAQDGSKRYVTEIVADEVEFLRTARTANDDTPDAPPAPDPDGYDDDLPFR